MSSDARETIVIDQFISGLPSKELRRHVQFHHHPTIHQAIALASEFESFDERFEGRKPENQERQEASVRALGNQVQSGADLKILQDLSDKVAKLIKRDAEESNEHAKNRRGACYNCGEQGHFASRCHKSLQVADADKTIINGPNVKESGNVIGLRPRSNPQSR
jgi:hypothetical protein